MRVPSYSSTSSRTIRQVRAPGPTRSSRWQYLDQSSTTAVLVHPPARLVPPPRDSSSAPCTRQVATAATGARTTAI
jgi:hypothetical protein